jgi:hypothetical protein
MKRRRRPRSWAPTAKDLETAERAVRTYDVVFERAPRPTDIEFLGVVEEN